MKIRQALTVLLVVALIVMVVQPARVEALEPTTIVLIAGAGVVVLVLVLYLVIANVRESQRTAQDVRDAGPMLVVLGQPVTQTP